MGRLRQYKVLVDGAAVGQIKEGGSELFAAPAGSHRVTFKNDWYGIGSHG